MSTDSVISTKAKIATAHGTAYTRRLCKHFANKVPAQVDGNRGRIEFPFGLCEIESDDEFMSIRVALHDACEFERAERVVGDHLLRMANKDDPVVTWIRQAE